MLGQSVSFKIDRILDWAFSTYSTASKDFFKNDLAGVYIERVVLFAMASQQFLEGKFPLIFQTKKRRKLF